MKPCSVLIWVITTGAFAQSALQFDAASLRPAADQSGSIFRTVTRGGPGTKDPGRLEYRSVQLKWLLIKAYGGSQFNVDAPAWMEKQSYDINATMPPDTTKEQFEQMLQNLLTERFAMKLHHENRDVAGYRLVVGKNGAKIKESGPEAANAHAPGERGTKPLQFDQDGQPMLMPGVTMAVLGRSRTVLGRQPISALVLQLTRLLEKPVVDATGLTGQYDIVLDYSPEGLGGTAAAPLPPGQAPRADSPLAPEEAKPSLFAALQDQLGLRLDSTKVPFDVVVIDAANRTPSGN